MSAIGSVIFDPPIISSVGVYVPAAPYRACASRGRPTVGTLFLLGHRPVPHTYQLLLITPGTSPESDNCRKQIRQSWNFLMKPRGLPQRLQRLWYRTANFFFFASFATADVRAIPSLLLTISVGPPAYGLKGIPSCFKSSRASSSDRAVVTIVTFIPRTLSTFA